MTSRERKNKKTHILVPEPRHRVGPKGVVSSGISFRDLPPPSLDEIKKICEHYQQKTAGTYKSLASRYVYQMATEIDHLVDALKDSGHAMEGSLSTFDDERDLHSSVESSRQHQRQKKRQSVNSNHVAASRGSDRRAPNERSILSDPHRSRPRTASGPRTKPSHVSYRRSTREFPMDSVDGVSIESSPIKVRHCHSSHRHRRSNIDSLAQHNLEDQNEEVLRWLKEEMKRSQSLINRSKQLHDAELVNAKKEVEKVKKAAKLLIKAVHKKGQDKAAKSEASAESERRRRMKSQKMIESMIHSHSAQIGLLKKGLRRSSSSTREAVEEFRDAGRFYPWGELQDDRTDVSFSVSDASDLTSILDDLAEEAFQASTC